MTNKWNRRLLKRNWRNTFQCSFPHIAMNGKPEGALLHMFIAHSGWTADEIHEYGAFIKGKHK